MEKIYLSPPSLHKEESIEREGRKEYRIVIS